MPPFAPTDKYSIRYCDLSEYPELGECLDLKLRPLDPHPDLVDLERGFVDYNHMEFHRLRAYLDRHGAIEKSAADAIRQSSTIIRDSLDISSCVASTDVPLEYLTLSGRPLVKTQAEAAISCDSGIYGENNSRISIADLDGRGRESLSMLRKSSSLAVTPGFRNNLLDTRPASRAIRQSGQIVRRTTTSALARLRGHRTRGGQKKRSSPLSDTREVPNENVLESPATPNRALPIMVQVPPSFIQMDPLTWTQLDREQRGLARRYCRKLIEENQRLMSMLLMEQEEDEELAAAAMSGDSNGREESMENVLFQSTYSLTASSLLSTTREAGSRRGFASAIPSATKCAMPTDPMPPLLSGSRPNITQSVTGSINSNSSCNSNSSSTDCRALSGPTVAPFPRKRGDPAVYLFSDMFGTACKSTPSLLPGSTQTILHQSQKELPRHKPKTTGTPRRLHAKSAGAASGSAAVGVTVPRLQPIAAKWPPVRQPNDPPKSTLDQKHKRHPFLDISDYGRHQRNSRSVDEIPMSPDPDDWDLLPETLDRLGLPKSEDYDAVDAEDEEILSSSIAIAKQHDLHTRKHIMQI
ncbi:hypothetical protein H4R24_005204 [Coemansia sp. RSA 988]|nr:hypothetical protein H4R24_005204 [Coemansia sp. RSA 988]